MKYIKDFDLKYFDTLKHDKIGVIAYITDLDGEILLQQRGKLSRDENFLYECVGGSLEDKDSSYIDALKREIKEEIGDINININQNMHLFYVPKVLKTWLFIVFEVTYISGDIKILEPDKCTGYKWFKFNDALSLDLVTESCKFLIKSINETH